MLFRSIEKTNISVPTLISAGIIGSGFGEKLEPAGSHDSMKSI